MTNWIASLTSCLTPLQQTKRQNAVCTIPPKRTDFRGAGIAAVQYFATRPTEERSVNGCGRRLKRRAVGIQYFTYPRADRYGILSRLHLRKSGNSLYSWTAAVHRRRGKRSRPRAISLYGSDLQREKLAAPKQRVWHSPKGDMCLMPGRFPTCNLPPFYRL